MTFNLEEILVRQFNFPSFREGQKEVIESIMTGNHTMAMLPTGTGKSLCYQLPGYLLKGQVIIVSPLLSLMQDQVEQMIVHGEKRVIAINSFLTSFEKKMIFQKLDQFKYIFISPEMLNINGVLEKLRKLNIALFVVDEAHCISQWGYDFRPDYRKLGYVRESLGDPVTLALTATATRDVVKDIVTSLHLQNWNEFILSVDRPNISKRIEVVGNLKEKQTRLIELVSTVAGPGIIYFSSKRLAEEMVLILKNHGVQKVMAYHGDMDHESRILIQQQFINGQLDCICATSAFGMGINKDNVRYVIHFHMPLQIESYLQEIGRAGRDGKKSIAILLYSPGDEQLSLQLIENELPNEFQIERVSDWTLSNLNKNLYFIEHESDIRKLAGLNEIQWRLIRDYLTTLNTNKISIQNGLKEFTDYIQKRMELKRKKIFEMKKWIQLKVCRREKILNYFGEQKKMDIEDCCDICGIDMKKFKKIERIMVSGNSPFHWKDHLSVILLNK